MIKLNLSKLELQLDSVIRAHENLFVTAALAVVTAFSLFHARIRPFWMDEYLTYDTAMLGSPGAVWKALHTLPLSVDPPLYHILLQWWLRIVSPTEFAARLPSVVAYTVMCFFLYCFVRKYMDVYAGLTAVALSLACGAFRYAHEARPYALVLGAVSMTLLCWGTIVHGQKNRVLALLGMFLGVALAVGSHWFGCLALVPFMLGELVRSWQSRKIDVGVWLALIAGAATVVFYLPLLRAASVYRSLPWKGVVPWDTFETLEFILGPCLIPLVVLMIAFVVVWFTFGVPRPNLEFAAVPTPVFVCVVSLALVSFPGLVFGKMFTHVFVPRYVLFCAIGLVVLVSGAIYSMVGMSPFWRMVAFTIVSVCVLLLRVHEARAEAWRGSRQVSSLADTSVFSQKPSIPIVITDDEDLFLQIEAHGSPSLRERCVWVTDPGAVGMTGQSTIYLSIEALRLWTRDPITDLPSFLNSYHRFYLVTYKAGGVNWMPWMIRRMMAAHAQISLQGTFAENPVFLVSDVPTSHE